MAEYTLRVVRNFTKAYTIPTDRFIAMLDYADPERKGKVLHEIAHCLRDGRRQLSGETPIATSRRVESTADAYEALYRIRDGEPDMANKLMITAEWRRSNLVISRAAIHGHYTTDTLRIIADDLRQDPDLATKLKSLSPADLEERAYAYALRGHFKDYPHLADKKMRTADKLARSHTVDQDLIVSSNFVSGSFLLSGYEQFPVSLSPAAALHIARLEYSATRFLHPVPGTQFAERMAQLRDKFPGITQAADKQFAEELQQTPLPVLPDTLGAKARATNPLRLARANQASPPLGKFSS